MAFSCKKQSSSCLTMMFICDEWKSTNGGLSTFNKYFAVNMAKYCRHISVFCYVSQADEEDIEDAKRNGVTLLKAEKLPDNPKPFDCLKILPKELQNPDVVVAHGRKFGQIVCFIVPEGSCCWVQILHVFYPDLAKYKASSSKHNGVVDLTEDYQNKHKTEIELCKNADAVLTVGRSLRRKYKKCLPDRNIGAITPGVLEDWPPQERLSHVGQVEVFHVLMFGRAEPDDRKLKGYDIVAEAVVSLGERFHLTFVGSQQNKQKCLEDWFEINAGIKKEQLTVCEYTDRDNLRNMLQKTDLFVLPSREDGFGMAALEALSTGTPMLVSKNSGIAHALRNVKNGEKCIVSKSESGEWARRIKEISNQQPAERYNNARRLRQEYGETYSWEKQCQKIANLVEEVVKSKGGNKENVSGSLVNTGSSTQSVAAKRKLTLNIPIEQEEPRPKFGRQSTNSLGNYMPDCSS
ncbi:glycogen synthase-like [Acropora millepora]|uniref:glycogen synthase-like n=1 Tax=Acropora millepora TaxID=45264 RepID=UPI001CF4AE47|nr:glycogen synthase-like [Acropora millepora]